MRAASRIEVLPASLAPASMSSFHFLSSRTAKQVGDFRLILRRRMNGPQNACAATFGGLGACFFKASALPRSTQGVHGTGQRAYVRPHGNTPNNEQGRGGKKPGQRTAKHCAHDADQCRTGYGGRRRTFGVGVGCAVSSERITIMPSRRIHKKRMEFISGHPLFHECCGGLFGFFKRIESGG